MKTLIKTYVLEIILIACSLVFSFWLMFTTFSYHDSSMLIASKAWSDFASHIPLIRSFSLGSNFPPEYSLFPGEPIRYHFLFYAFVGMLEKGGIRIDFALDIPSALSFTGLLCMIYFFAKTLFQSKLVGILSVLFFLFNGSLSFLEFFKDHPLSLQTIQEIISNVTFPSFAPYGKGIVSAFWNLNIYTNQRHLALSYAVSLFLLYFLLKPVLENRKPKLSNAAAVGIALGLSFFLHKAVFLMNIIAISFLFILFKQIRLTTFLTLVLGGIIALPQYLFMKSTGSQTPVFFYPGYLIHETLTVHNFIYYWFMNVGLHTIFIPLGVFLSSVKAKKIFLCFFPFFIIGNLFQFSNEIAANHKFFNYFLIGGSMYSAYALVFLFKKFYVAKPIAVVSLFFLIFSGIIDFFPIYNDTRVQLLDYKKDPDIYWIKNNTPADTVFLNTTYLYDKASIAGRKIMLGWPYFAWSQGYDTYKRDAIRKNLFNPESLTFFCNNTVAYNIGHVSINTKSSDINFVINKDFFEHNFKKVYENKQTGLTIFSTQSTCRTS